MRKKIAAGNWKMNLTEEKAQWLVSEIMGVFKDEIRSNVEIIFGTPAPFLSKISHLTKDHPNFHVAAQNVHQEAAGAYTGETSASMIRSVGASHVIIGHSERRQYFAENDTLLADKVDAALTESLTPIFCIGETLDQRETGSTFDILQTQLSEGTFHLSPEAFDQLTIAYEPVWAIGTGKTASPEQAQEVHAHLRSLIQKHYNETIADNCSILYGGSVKPSNAQQLFSQPDIDGGLVGGASLKSRDFTDIIKAFG